MMLIHNKDIEGCLLVISGVDGRNQDEVATFNCASAQALYVITDM